MQCVVEAEGCGLGGSVGFRGALFGIFGDVHIFVTEVSTVIVVSQRQSSLRIMCPSAQIVASTTSDNQEGTPSLAHNHFKFSAGRFRN
mmetsp:Transcript_20610/g.47615  ORF Transcript_20610/g.47615 Transcript_20610/m.47615 type:complete len:88 (+) Transcript_20610:178-441(+)